MQPQLLLVSQHRVAQGVAALSLTINCSSHYKCNTADTDIFRNNMAYYIRAGHLHGPQTHAKIAQLQWWLNMNRGVNPWVARCHDCSSRKARLNQVIPPLKNIKVGEKFGDLWEIDVAGSYLVQS